MNKLLRIIGLAAVLTASTTLPAQAMHGQQEYVVVFYDDESHTNIVGHNVIYCDGHFVHVGERTLYTDEIYYGCS